MWIAIACGAALLGAFILLAYRRGWAWTGFTGKTLWDWLSLLVIPAGLALVLFVLDDAQSRRERERTEAGAQRAARVEADRRRAALLSEYLQRMSDLMLAHGLARARPSAPVADLASTLTLTVLGQLDGRRKAQVLLFLDRAGLIDPARGRLVLTGADFRRTDAHGIGFPRAMGLRGVDFRGSRFDRAAIVANPGTPGGGFDVPFEPSVLYGDFRGASFRGARLTVTFGPSDLRGADLSEAGLSRTSFEGCLAGARFRRASLFDVTFDGARGAHVDFTGAFARATELRVEARRC